MSTHNIGFYEDLTKIIFELSSNIIKYAPYFFCCFQHDNSILQYIENLLFQAFNPETEFHYKNKGRRDRTAWEEKFEGREPFSVAPSGSFNKVREVTYLNLLY